MTHDEKLWQTKLAARIHDPFEKALVLLRDRAGHEGGTTAVLRDFLPLDQADKNAVKRADWWASAADRPQWPQDQWAHVRWFNQPVLIHPLSGAEVDLRKAGGLSDTEIGDIKERSRKHFVDLGDAVGKDAKKTLLAYWRFGSELRESDDNGSLGALWPMLPADTRVPDHTIADHIDLTSAFAGAFAADPNGDAALLALSIGPVQPFIAAARSTSDLWSGSHLLARLSWEVMKPIAEALGPDAILFPRLRGIPQVDLWLRDECGLPAEWFTSAEWMKGGTDANPLFAAALPNRLVAVVPASQAKALAEKCREHVRDWLQALGETVVDRLLAEIGETHPDAHCYRQVREQLAGFPEVHWASVPFSLIHPRNQERQTDLDTLQLSEAMAPFFGVKPDEPAGFLETDAWKVLSKDIEWQDGTRFFAPNPGVLYPAIYDLTERVMAAAKSVRVFNQSEQRGWRCALTGETEWLTLDPAQLESSYRQQSDTLWARIAKKRPAWAKKGEHLGALPAIKRLWPTLFAEEAGKALGKESKQSRFVISTHTMALAHQLDQWLAHGGSPVDDLPETPSRSNVALPKKLVRTHHDNPAFNDAKKLINSLEEASESNDEAEKEAIRRAVKHTLGNGGDKDKPFQLETYYGLLLMDGDHMGRILSGDEKHAISYLDSFHPVLRKGFQQKMAGNKRLRQYAEQKRAVSPNRHLAISGALNDFSQHIVSFVVEDEHLGKLIYAGGDDVLAMLPTADLLPAAQRLRRAYCGVDPDHEGGFEEKGLSLNKGFAFLNGKLYRCMGENATASAGLVVAHHQTPLARVLRELREAESIAKNAGRDRFHLRIIKRSGGALNITLPWDEPLRLLQKTRDFLADPAVSRRAVYHTLVWLKDLPEAGGNSEMLAELLAYQFQRQTDKKTAEDYNNIPGLTADLALMTTKMEGSLDWLANFLSIAEFLARETRSGGAS